MNTKPYKAVDQLIFWVFMFLFIIDYHLFEGNWGEAFSLTALEIVTYGIVSYCNYLWLMPTLFKKKNYVLFGISALLLISFMVVGMRGSGLENYLYEIGGWRNLFSMVLNYSLFFLLSSLYWYFKQWQQAREHHLQMRSEKLEAELKFLKTQISPHFLFNTLNNIYALAYQKHDNAAPMVAKLSKIMRYLLDNGNSAKVSLKKEIETLQHFIDLHLLRKPLSQNIDLYIEGVLNQYQIAPLLLINFVENCFKHSDIDKNEEAWIKVSLEITPEGQLLFITENSHQRLFSNSSSGIGLENTRRQLELHYPKQHELKIEQKDTYFKVALTINLKEDAKKTT